MQVGDRVRGETLGVPFSGRLARMHEPVDRVSGWMYIIATDAPVVVLAGTPYERWEREVGIVGVNHRDCAPFYEGGNGWIAPEASMISPDSDLHLCS